MKVTATPRAPSKPCVIKQHNCAVTPHELLLTSIARQKCAIQQYGCAVTPQELFADRHGRTPGRGEPTRLGNVLVTLPAEAVHRAEPQSQPGFAFLSESCCFWPTHPAHPGLWILRETKGAPTMHWRTPKPKIMYNFSVSIKDSMQ